AVANRPLRVLIDGRCLAFPMSGTQVNVLALLRSLAARSEVEVAVLLPETVHPSLLADLRDVPGRIERQTNTRTLPRPDVFHRPYQLLFERELGDVLGVGDRLVITQQDVILARTPAYFGTRRLWESYAALTRLSLLAADHVAFFSEHARRQALEEAS